MSEWQKDLSAVAFEAADLVQRVRAIALACESLCDRVPEQLQPTVARARFSIDAAVKLIEDGAEALCQIDDEQQLEALADIVHIQEAGPRYSHPDAAINVRGGFCSNCGGPLVSRAIEKIPGFLCLECGGHIVHGKQQ